MTRLVLLILLALLTWAYFPETRAILMDAAEPVLTPIVRWGAEEEMATVARNAIDQERLSGKLPVGSAWLGWLHVRYASADATKDPWGSVYQAVASKDSIWVLSLGPDRTRDTDDDFVVAMARSAPQRHK